MAIIMITPTKLRKDIYKILDQVLETGVSVKIERQGKTLRIVPDEPVDKFQRLTYRPHVIVGDPEELVHLEWEHNLDLP